MGKPDRDNEVSLTDTSNLLIKLESFAPKNVICLRPFVWSRFPLPGSALTSSIVRAAVKFHPMGIHGTLNTMSVSDLLQFLAAGRKTGTLKLGRGAIVKEIFLEH